MSSLFRSSAMALLVASIAGVSASAQTQAGSPVTTTPAPTVTRLAPMISSAPSFMAEIEKHITDSVALASMGSRERYLQLQKDNRYLERVLRDQDRRLDALEKRLVSLKDAKAKLEADTVATPDFSGRRAQLEAAIARAERLTVPPNASATP